jgi:hypothetical protein
MQNVYKALFILLNCWNIIPKFCISNENCFIFKSRTQPFSDNIFLKTFSIVALILCKQHQSVFLKQKLLSSRSHVRD